MKKIALALCAVLSAVFMATGCVSREKESSSDPSVIGPSNVEIYLPDGAPALAMAEQLHWDREGDSKHYYVVNAQTIQTYVTGEAPKADLCILPFLQIAGDGGDLPNAGDGDARKSVYAFHRRFPAIYGRKFRGP